jgi:large subunit ribosomal protein L4
MFKARYYKTDGKKGRAQALPDSIFDGIVHEGAMHQVVTAFLANQRQGTAAAKSRSDVRGGSRKPWRQKGTGRARQGTIRAAQWEGGGRAFPPIPHSWRQRVPRKVRSLARRSALNDRAENDRVVVVDLPALETPKTREIVAFLEAIELGGKTLILTNGRNRQVYLSARNLEGVEVLPFGEESVYDVLWAHTVVIEKGALDGIEGEAPAEKKVAAKKKAPAKKAPAKKAAAKKAAAKKKESEEAPAAEAGTEDEAVAEAAAEPVAEAEVEAVAAGDDGESADDSPADEGEETEEKTDA